MQICIFRFFNLNLAQLKSFSFSVSMVSFVTFQCAFLQRDQQKTRKNLDVSKLEICAGVLDFLFQTFEHFYIVIWSCMLLKNVLEILPF
jgi:hypothetical protein